MNAVCYQYQFFDIVVQFSGAKYHSYLVPGFMESSSGTIL
jgi:hypothetical protein